MKFSSLHIFLIAGLFQRAVPFILLPVFTRSLGPANYGLTSILASVFVVLSFTATLGQEVVLFRYGPQALANDGHFAQSKRAHAVLFFMAAKTTLIAPAFLFSLSGFLALFVRSNTTALAFCFTFMGAALSSGGLALVGAILRLRNQAKKYAAFIVLSTLAVGLSKFTFVVILDLSVLGWALGDLVSGLLVYFTAIPILVRLHPVATDVNIGGLDQRAHIIKIGLGTLPGKVSQWVTGLSDRFLIGIFIGLPAAGQYALATQLCALGTVLITEICRFVMPKLNSVPLGSSRLRYLSSLFERQVLLFGLVAITVALGMGAVPFIFGDSFQEAAKIGTWLSLSLLLTGIAYFLNDAIGVSIGRPLIASRAFIGAALVSVLGNLSLLPFVGIYGAVLSQFAALLFTVFMLIVSANKLLLGSVVTRKSAYLIFSAFVCVLVISAIRMLCDS